MQLRYLPLVGLLLMSFSLFSQQLDQPEKPSAEAQPLSNTINQNITSAHKAEGILPFVAIKEVLQPATGLARKINMNLDKEMMRELYQKDLENLDLSIPYFEGKTIELELHQYDLLTDDFKITTSDQPDGIDDLPLGRFYRGSVKGDPLSTVAFSVFPDEIIGMITQQGENIVVHPEEDSDQYVMYNDSELSRDLPFSCDALDHPEQNDNELYGESPESSNCVEVYLECDYALYQNKGSSSATVNWITAVFNNMATLYSNESITTAISEIFVWTTPDSYSKTSSYSALTAFRSARSTYNGDLAHLAALGGRNIGGIAWLDVLCSSYGYAYSNISSSYSTVPTYSWTVEVMTHEMGHNLGSNHTHWCGWTGGAIDNCATPEGGCSRGPAPSGGGTIMSYCHLTTYGINFNKGFGTQPGDKIRSEVSGAPCLGSCGGGGGGGCSTPTGLSATNITTSGADISWNSVSGATSYTLDYRPTGGTWSSVTTTGTSYVLSGLSSTTTYECRVQATCSGGTSSWSGTITFTTKGTTKYCTSKGQSSSREWISRVRTGTIDRSSGSDGGYYDATALSSTMTKGQYNLIYFQAGKTGGRRNFYWRIWLDLNGDGDFTDAGELRVSGYSSYTGLLYSYVYVPTSATTGSTRMRVSMRYGGYPQPCQTFSRGEVEDYTIDIKNAGTLESGLDGDKGGDEWTISPNPTNDVAMLNFQIEQDAEIDVRILDQWGRSSVQVSKTALEGQNFMELPTANLPTGHYFVQIRYNHKTILKRLVKR